MQYLIGFVIAVFIALTGVGAGTITTPLLILFLGVPAETAVSTGLMFSAAVKLVLVPSQIARRQVNWKVLAYMLLGGAPGVIIGSLFLSHLVTSGSKHAVNGLLGAILLFTALYQLLFSFRKAAREQTGSKHSCWWMTALMFPVGAEVGFSSAGAGALGTAALLSITSLAPAQVVGTDILFGFVVSLLGSGAHWFAHNNNPTLLKHLVIGGVPGAIFGTYASRFVERETMRLVLCVWLAIIGVQFLYGFFHAGHAH